MDDFGRMGRAELLHRIGDLTDSVACLKRRIGQLESGDEYRLMAENLTAAQARGSELIDETRALRRSLQTQLTSDDPTQAFQVHGEQMSILVDLLTVRWRGDAKYGGAEAHSDVPLNFEGLHGSFDPHFMLRELRKQKNVDVTGYRTWAKIVLEEVLELFTALGDAQTEAEAIDVANVCLKMVEAIRIRRARQVTE